MSATDPLGTIWQALDRHGCQPHGQAHSFRARCPLHDGDSYNSLAVNIGADGRALLHCFRCNRSGPEIAVAIGIPAHELHPAGHRGGNPFLTLPEAQRADFGGNARQAANVLLGLEKIGMRWRVEITIHECPYCGSPNARLVVPDSPGDPFVHCRGACSWRMLRDALAGLVRDARGAR